MERGVEVDSEPDVDKKMTGTCVLLTVTISIQLESSAPLPTAIEKLTVNR